MPLQGGPKNVNTDEERKCDEDEYQNTDSDGNVAEFSFHDRTCQEKTKDGATWEQSQRQEFIIIGYSDARKGERALGALYLCYRTNGNTKYAGKVGTGFSIKTAGLAPSRSCQRNTCNPM